MEVHPPHEKVHTWRDFFVHVAIMTVGLFIALTLESFVESMHHRHVVHEARENIRQEIKDNHEAAQKDLAFIQQAIARNRANVKTIHALATNEKDFHGDLTYSMNFVSLNSAAWNTSRETGAFAYMPYTEVKAYSTLYDDQKFVSEQAVDLMRRQSLAMAPMYMGDNNAPGLRPDEARLMLHETAATLINLDTLKQIVQQLDTHYVEALKNPE